MIPVSYIVFLAALKLLVMAGGILYAGLVLMSYRTDGPRAPLRLDFTNPARSAVRLTVWLGVKMVKATLRAATALFNMLSEASAEVGEWFLRQRSPEVQAEYRSRFMV